MDNTFTIRDLQYKVREREAEKEQLMVRLDGEIEALNATIRILEGEGTENIRTSRPASHGSEVTNAMYKILLAERPLHRTKILEKVQAWGIYVGGNTPVNSLGSYLSQDPRFKNIGRGLWTLADEPQPQDGQDDTDAPAHPPEAQEHGVEVGPDTLGPIPDIESDG